MDENRSPIKHHCKHGHSLEDAYSYERPRTSRTGESRLYQYLVCRTCSRSAYQRSDRHKPRPDYNITDDQIVLSYAAGLFDGEGSVSIRLLRKPNSEYRFHNLSLSITSTNREIIDWLINTFDGKANKHNSKGNQREAWKWTLFSSHAEKFLRSTYPYLIIKKPQADIAFKLRDTLGNRGRYVPVTPELFSEREELRFQMKELNRRGIDQGEQK